MHSGPEFLAQHFEIDQLTEKKREKKMLAAKNILQPVKIFYNPLAAFNFGSGAFGNGGV